jgi:hypothetical protein
MAVITAPAAVAANISRRDIMSLAPPLAGRTRCTNYRATVIARPHSGLTKTGIDLAAGVLLF